MSKPIFAVYSCGRSKRDEDRLLMATTSIRKLKSFIAVKIEGYKFHYTDGSGIEKQHLFFKSDFDLARRPVQVLDVKLLNDRLINARIEIFYDGEEIQP